MVTLKLTEDEYLALKRAVEAYADVMGDADDPLDSITAIDLWPKDAITVTPEQMETFRDQILEGIDRVITLRTLIAKLDGGAN